VIVLIDKELFEYPVKEGERFAGGNNVTLTYEIQNEIISRLSFLRLNISPDDRLSFYGIKQVSPGQSEMFYSRRLNMEAGDLGLLSSHVKEINEEELNKYINTNLFDLLSKNNDIDQNSDQFFDSTIIITFSKGVLNSSLTTDKQTMFRLVELEAHRFNNNHEYNYNIALEAYSEGQAYDSIVPKLYAVPLFEFAYQLCRKNVDVFKMKGVPVPFKYNRKTIPGSEYIRLFPTADSTLPIMMESGSQVNVVWCELLNIEGSNSHHRLSENYLPKKFNKNNTGSFSSPLGVNAVFPFSELIKDLLLLDGADPVDTAYYGTMVIRYNLEDPVYSHAVFNDTIPFKLAVKEPMYLQAGLLKKILINNEVLLKYANILNASKEWTQEEVAAQYTINIKIVVGVIILLSVALIFLVKRLLIDKKRLTLIRFTSFKA
jgi:predicted nucleic-acid-binding protein